MADYNLIESLDLIEAKDANTVKVCCGEDVDDILNLLGLQLVGHVDDELSEVVQVHSLLARLQVDELLLMGPRNGD